MSDHRLHELEAAIELYSSDPFIFRPAELYEVNGGLRKALERFNLYLVARRPRMSLNPESLHLSTGGESIGGVIDAQVGGGKTSMPFQTTLPEHLRAARIGEHEYPFDWLRFYTPEGLPVQIRLHDVLRFSDVPKSPLTDMHVEYVGKAYGEAGERDVVDRLIGNTGKAGHGSLQKILAEVNASHPDQEVHLLLYSYEFQQRHIIAGGHSNQPQPLVDFDAAPERLDQFLDSSIARGIRIELAEAALIRYFGPAYNEKYKTTFPDRAHTILGRLRELDITGLAVSLSTLEHNLRVASPRVSPSDRHYPMYSIATDEDRQSFFDIATPGILRP